VSVYVVPKDYALRLFAVLLNYLLLLLFNSCCCLGGHWHFRSILLHNRAHVGASLERSSIRERNRSNYLLLL
jgi:hypothetical protein